jgi:hypothetical protein
MVNKNLLILFVALFCFGLASAEGGGLLALKDRGVIVRSFTRGSYINFKFSNQQWVTGYVDRIQKDSIDINQFVLQQGYTAFGTWGVDTLKLGLLTLHVSEIIAFAHEKGHYTSAFANGSVLKYGGPFYAGLNITNSIIKKEEVFGARNLPHVLGGVAAWFIGKWQSNKNPNYRIIGKRYTVEII